jgi:hypothetical protein
MSESFDFLRFRIQWCRKRTCTVPRSCSWADGSEAIPGPVRASAVPSPMRAAVTATGTVTPAASLRDQVGLDMFLRTIKAEDFDHAAPLRPRRTSTKGQPSGTEMLISCYALRTKNAAPRKMRPHGSLDQLATSTSTTRSPSLRRTRPVRLLFADRGCLIHNQRLSRMWKRSRTAARWPEVATFHYLRRYFATPFTAGGDPTDVPSAIRHVSLRISLETYVHWWCFRTLSAADARTPSRFRFGAWVWIASIGSRVRRVDYRRGFVKKALGNVL